MDVGLSVGTIGAAVSVGRGVKVKVEAGIGVKVSEAGMLEAVFTAMAEAEIVGVALLRLHARVVVIKRMSKDKSLIFITSLY